MFVMKSSKDWLQKALDTLTRGGCIAHATETCYGLACDLTNQEAVARLFRIKQRSERQPVSALFASIEEAKRYVEWTDAATELAAGKLPGPMTIILPLRNDIPLQLFPTPLGGKTIGIRVSPHPIALELAQAFGRPLSTTSANLHGQPNPYDATTIVKQFEGMPDTPDGIVDSGTIPVTPPSTVIDLTNRGKILRS